MDRVLDGAGLVFENHNCATLAEALAALEEGLAGRVLTQQAALRSSSPPVKKTHRRPRDNV